MDLSSAEKLFVRVVEFDRWRKICCVVCETCMLAHMCETCMRARRPTYWHQSAYLNTFRIHCGMERSVEDGKR